MGGPGSGGFRGFGWPPGSQPGPDMGAEAKAKAKARKPRKTIAKRAKKYRATRGKRATEREYALNEARRNLKRGLAAKRAPRGWRKLKGTDRSKSKVLAMHYALQIWLRCKMVEFTSCADNLVLVEVQGRLDGAERRDRGPKPKLRKLMAFPVKELWIEQ